MELKDKKVLVFGTGLSGIGAAALLYKKGAEPVIYDGNVKTEPEQVKEKLGKDIPARILIGALPEEVLDELDLAVLSPGVPIDIPAVNMLRDRGIPIWGEVELAYANSKGNVLAITGTNGKTTTNTDS